MLFFDLGVYLNLLLNIPSIVAGGSTGLRIALTHFITSTSPPEMLSNRFMIFNTCLLLGENNKNNRFNLSP